MTQINLTTPPYVTENQNQLSGVNVQTAPALVSNSSHDNFEQDEYYVVAAGVFFDGTYNNRYNVDHPEVGEQFKQNTSYTYDYSNVARAEPAYYNGGEGRAKQFSVYIEGVGTDDGVADYVDGGGFGTGKAGIEEKVTKACKAIADAISEAGITHVQGLIIETFGFSRGAAAARNFLHEISKRGTRSHANLPAEDYGKLGKALRANGIEVRSMHIYFTGLYDTVSSHGLNFSNDTAKLGLDAVRNSTHVLQLVADDECGKNFSLTNINSKGHLEKHLPGTHADIGGLYVDNAVEDFILNKGLRNERRKMERDRQYLIDQSWYLPNELTIENRTTSVRLLGKRTVPRRKYSYIPLHIMTQYAINQRVEFDMGKIESSYSIPHDLTYTKERLYDYVFNNGPQMTFRNDYATMRFLRREYLHFSGNFGSIGMEPRMVGGKRVREILEG